MNGEIEKADVAPLMLTACPSFHSIWDSDSRDFNINDETGERLGYLDAGDFARHLVSLLAEGETGSFPAVFEVIERLHREGDDYVRELATIGYLEGLQFAASHEPRVEESDFVPFLGPESLRWWRGLVAFWNGSATTVEPLDA